MNVAACTASVKTRAVSLCWRAPHRSTAPRGCTTPVSLLASMTATNAVVSSTCAANALYVDHSVVVDRQLRTSAPRACAPRPGTTHARQGAPPAELTTETGVSRHRGRRPPQRAQHGQVGRLRAPGGEDDVAGIAPERSRHLVAGFLEQAPGPLRRAVAPGRIARAAPTGPRPWPPPLRAAAAWWRRGRDTS